MDRFWISVSNKKVYAIHSDEPRYNRLHDRWDSFTKVPTTNLSNLLPTIDTKNIIAAAYYVGNVNSNNKFDIIETVNAFK